jgi:hypothetical protein
VEEIRWVDAERSFNKSWQEWEAQNQTLTEEILISDAELSQIEDEIREIRELRNEEE